MKKNEPYQCAVCELTFPNYYTYIRHIWTAHKQVNGA